LKRKKIRNQRRTKKVEKEWQKGADLVCAWTVKRKTKKRKTMKRKRGR
jgi:hypothetical protein